MLGLWGAHTAGFLLAVVAVTTPVFALPLFLVPLAWARGFGWRIPEHTDLAVYFGRCLGAFVLVLELMMLRAGLTGAYIVPIYQMLIAIAAFMVVVHIWGAVKRIQPLSETLEIGMYSGLGLLAVLFYPS